MSQYLGCNPGGPIDLGASVADVHTRIKGDLTATGWRVVSETIPTTPTNAAPTQLFMVPPATEAIGNAQCREVLLMEFGADYIRWRPVTEALLPYPQTLIITPKTGGAASNAITLGGVTVQQDPATLNALNTADQNLRYLYEAIAGSSDPVMIDWDWLYSYPAAQNANDLTPHIYGIRKTAAPNQTLAGANVTAATLGNYAAAGMQNPSISNYPTACSVETDLTNGFIYFLQINARGIALAARTNKNYTGPLHACWGNHAQALAAVPDAGKFSKFISPIELLVGVDEDANNLHATARPAKVWNRSYSYPSEQAANYPSHTFSRFLLAGQGFTDANNSENGAYLGTSEVLTLKASSIWTGDEAGGNDFQIHSISMDGNHVRQNGPGINTNMRVRTAVIGAITIDDWYKFRGTATDENLQFVADTVATTTLAQAMDGATDYPSIALVSTAGLAPAGMVVIELEAIEYTGISGNMLTGCTRGKYASKRVKHFTGTVVNQGLWFIKINGGAILVGTSKPAVP